MNLTRKVFKAEYRPVLGAYSPPAGRNARREVLRLDIELFVFVEIAAAVGSAPMWAGQTQTQKSRKLAHNSCLYPQRGIQRKRLKMTGCLSRQEQCCVRPEKGRAPGEE